MAKEHFMGPGEGPVPAVTSLHLADTGAWEQVMAFTTLNPSSSINIAASKLRLTCSTDPTAPGAAGEVASIAVTGNDVGLGGGATDRTENESPVIAKWGPLFPGASVVLDIEGPPAFVIVWARGRGIEASSQRPFLTVAAALSFHSPGG